MATVPVLQKGKYKDWVRRTPGVSLRVVAATPVALRTGRFQLKLEVDKSLYFHYFLI